ncbi:MAG: DUF4055 domain-containing protein [Deltaproteobacteria bacterium]|nr:DUF4055 domain-containing protein [Deltaproteobacteria bacterium]
MPIDTTHPEYDARVNLWSKCRDVVEGEEAVKAAGETYLPKLSRSQDQRKYDSYKYRAVFFDATSRTVEGLTGAPVRKEPVIKLPEALADLVGKDDLKKAVRELLITGRLGLLVDMDDAGTGLPYLTAYKAEQITTWRADQWGDPSLVVLREEREDNPDDPFDMSKEVIFRELALASAMGEGAEPAGKIYQVRVWVKNKADQKWMVESTLVPLRQGKPLERIPFICFGPSGLGFEAAKPPILGLVNANLGHYRQEADYRHAMHHTALPTPCVKGIPKPMPGLDGKPAAAPVYEIGSGTAWVLEEGGDAWYLEFTGHGLSDMKESLAALEQRMAVLGARLIEGQRTGVEAAETARIRQAGEVSALIAVTSSVSLAYTAAAKQAAWWAGSPEGDVEVTLNEDFVGSRLSDTDADVLLRAVQAGQISFDTFWYNLQQGEIAPDGRTAEEEQTLIENQNPRLEGQPLDLGNDQGGGQ